MLVSSRRPGSVPDSCHLVTGKSMTTVNCSCRHVITGHPLTVVATHTQRARGFGPLDAVQRTNHPCSRFFPSKQSQSSLSPPLPFPSLPFPPLPPPAHPPPVSFLVFCYPFRSFNPPSTSPFLLSPLPLLSSPRHRQHLLERVDAGVVLGHHGHARAQATGAHHLMGLALRV